MVTDCSLRTTCTSRYCICSSVEGNGAQPSWNWNPYFHKERHCMSSPFMLQFCVIFLKYMMTDIYNSITLSRLFFFSLIHSVMSFKLVCFRNIYFLLNWGLESEAWIGIQWWHCLQSRSVHTSWTLSHFVTMQPQTTMYFIGILCDKIPIFYHF